MVGAEQFLVTAERRLQRISWRYPMPDDPNKRGKADRSRVSKQKHEQAYQRKKASRGSSKKK
jgi:hypothetical protein